MSRSEFDANQALLDVVDPLEQTQRMPVIDRRYRMHEGRMQAWVARDAEIQRQIDAHVGELAVKHGW